MMHAMPSANAARQNNLLKHRAKHQTQHLLNNLSKTILLFDRNTQFPE
jgi:hypothetical protein